MKLEQLVVSLDLAKQLKEAGYKQDDSLFYYWIDKILDKYTRPPELVYGLPKSTKDSIAVIAAPTSADIGEQLPWCFELHFNPGTKQWSCEQESTEIATSKGSFSFPDVGGVCFFADTEADARAQCWLYLKHQGLLTTKEET